MRGLKLFSMWPKVLLNEIMSDLGWRPEGAPLNDPNLLRTFERQIFLANSWHGRLYFDGKNDGIGVIGKYREEV